jgi:glycosyltransferase involved in cell wall biosynthesis
MPSEIKPLLILRSVDSVGMGAYLDSLSRGLASEGIEYRIACGEGRLGLTDEDEKAVYRIEGLSTRFHNILSFRSSFRKLRKQNFSVVHILFEKGVSRLLRAARIIKRPTVVTVHSPVDENSTHLVKKPVKLLVTSSEAARSSLVNRGGIPKEQIVLVPPLIDTSLFDSFHPPENEIPVIGFVGDIEADSGVDTLVEAISRILAKDIACHLLLVGKGKGEKRLRALIKQKNLTKKTTFITVYPSYLDILKAIDIYVVCSAKEDEQASTLLAAMAASKPVITNASHAIPDIVEDNKTALLVSAGNVDEMADALGKLLKDQELSNRIGKEASNRVRECFPLKKSIEALLSVYQAIREG